MPKHPLTKIPQKVLVHIDSRTVAAKECVTTHLPNELALKMDGAEASHLYSTICVVAKHK